jgi:SAM-dependent methyltransferase
MPEPGDRGAATPGPANPGPAMPGAADRMRLFGILSSPWIAQSCYALVKLGIPDLMAAGPRPVAELAASAGADPRALHRLLRALSAVGLVHEAPPGSYGLTTLAQPLRSGVPRSNRDAAIMFGEEVFRSFADITYTLRTGKPAFEKVYGQPFYDYLAGHPDAAQTFGTAMGGAGVPAVLSGCDFGGPRTVVDVGGGNGALLARVLRAHPQARGILLDRPAAAAQAKDRLTQAGVADRAEIVEASFFDEMPGGADVYVLCRVLHNWADEEAVALLRRIRQAMAAGGRVIVIEDLVQPPADQTDPQARTGQLAGPAGAEVMDLLILLMLSGCDRSESEYASLLGTAGFAVTAVRPPPLRGRSVESAIEAAPA